MIISEKDEFTRLGLKSALQSNKTIEILGDYATDEAMLSDLSCLKPDVVVLGITDNILDRCKTCREVRTLHPSVKVLTLSEKQRDDDLYETILSGASGDVLKSAGSEEMIKSVGVVACGGLKFDGEAIVRLLGRIPRHRGYVAQSLSSNLTVRERKIMVLVAKGDTNEEIGHRLKLSKFTVRNNVIDIRSKFGLKSRTELAAFAVQHGFMDASGQFDVNVEDSD